jgi:hypothetical protein
MEQWQAQGGDPALTESHAPNDVEDEDVDEDKGEPDLEQQPPSLPHLPVRHFFPGLVVRVGCDISDAYGRMVATGRVLRLLICELDDNSSTLSFRDRTLLLLC